MPNNKIEAFGHVWAQLNLGALSQIDVRQILEQCNDIKLKKNQKGYILKGSLEQMNKFNELVTSNNQKEELTPEIKSSVVLKGITGEAKTCLEYLLDKNKTVENKSSKGALFNKNYDIVHFCFTIANNSEDIKCLLDGVSITRKDRNAPEIRLTYRNSGTNTEELIHKIQNLYKIDPALSYIYHPVKGSPTFLYQLANTIEQRFEANFILIDRVDDNTDIYICCAPGLEEACKEFLTEYKEQDNNSSVDVTIVQDILDSYCDGINEKTDDSISSLNEDNKSLQVDSGNEGYKDAVNSSSTAYEYLSNKKNVALEKNHAEIDKEYYTCDEDKNEEKEPQEKTLQVDLPSVEYIKGIYMDTVKKLEKEHNVTLELSHNNGGIVKVYLAKGGVINDQIISAIAAQLQDICHSLVTIFENVPMSKPPDQFLHLKEKAKHKKVLLSLNLEPGQIAVIGPRDEVSILQNELREIFAVKPKRERKLVATPAQQPAQSSAHGVNIQAKHSSLMSVSYKHLDTNVYVHVEMTDMTKMQVDAIVNAANENLQHIGGLAQAISRAGGPVIDKESKEYIRKYQSLPIGRWHVTSAGHMPCEKVIHVVGPRWYDYKNTDTVITPLKKTFQCVLTCTERNRFRSVAIPAISSGIYGVPKYLVADVACSVIEEFLTTSNSTPYVRHIYLVDTGHEIVGLFQKHMDGWVEKKKFVKHSPVNTQGTEDSNEAHEGIGAKPKRKMVSVNGSDKSSSPVSSNKEKKPNGNLSYASAVSQGSTTTHTPAGSNSKSTKTQNSTSIDNANDKVEEENCCICMDDLKQPKTLDKCQHTFCTECIESAFKVKPACPICNTIYGMIRGNQPDGKMVFKKTKTRLSGYPKHGCIEITYSFQRGIQNKNHPNPGKHYTGTQRTAYLPDNARGNKVLQLLQKAFDARLVFTIGHSRTTGADNVVTWNDIHHKTSRDGGPDNFGYPDKTYLNRVTEELAAKGIQ